MNIHTTARIEIFNNFACHVTLMYVSEGWNFKMEIN